ncbi:phage portal protein [Leptospira levettii]|uniref:phage portal protein n=1 Tax=Leptospira levettii TaxID=2023178 RepID=UPI0013FD3580|nr:phage portal protein [Leptospira levettii]
MGRPRSHNYEKNKAKLERTALRKAGALALTPTSSGNNKQTDKQDQFTYKGLSQMVPRENFERVVSVTKSLMAHIDNENLVDRYAGKKPVFNHDEYSLLSNGVHLRPPWRISTDELRKASYTNSLIGAIHKIKVDDLSRFFNISKKEGFYFEMVDEDESPNDEDKKLIKNACEFYRLMGDKCEGWSRRDKLHTVGEMMIRDTLTIDSVCFWLIKNAWGKVLEIRYLDPGTIFPVLPDGYRGDVSIGWVQVIDGQVTETFGHDEIIWKHQNHSSDIRMRGHGISPTEASMLELIMIMYILKKNRDRQSNRTPPEGFISINRAIGPDALDSLVTQWRNVFSGGLNNYAIPILAADDAEVKYNPLNLGTDIVFDKALEWATGLVCAAHGTDPMEIGLKIRDSGALSEASPDGRIKNSMTRSKRAMLAFFSDCFNDIRDHIPEISRIKQVFTGIDQEDEKAKLDSDIQKLKSFMTLDEIRRTRDLPPLEKELIDSYGLDAEQVKGIGGIILDTTFSQFAGSKLSPPQDEGMGMEGGEDFGGEEDFDSEEEEFVDEDGGEEGDEMDEDFDPDNQTEEEPEEELEDEDLKIK